MHKYNSLLIPGTFKGALAYVIFGDFEGTRPTPHSITLFTCDCVDPQISVTFAFQYRNLAGVEER